MQIEASVRVLWVCVSSAPGGGRGGLAMRPASAARPGPPKPAAGMSGGRSVVIEREEGAFGAGKRIGGAQAQAEEDEDAEFVVSTAPVPLGTGLDSGLSSLKVSGAAGAGAEADGEQHGELVKSMLEAKKQLEGGSHVPGGLRVQVVCTHAHCSLVITVLSSDSSVLHIHMSLSRVGLLKPLLYNTNMKTKPVLTMHINIVVCSCTVGSARQ